MPWNKVITIISEIAPPVYFGLVVILVLIAILFTRPPLKSLISIKKFLLEYVANVDVEPPRRKHVAEDKVSTRSISAGSR